MYFGFPVGIIVYSTRGIFIHFFFVSLFLLQLSVQCNFKLFAPKLNYVKIYFFSSEEHIMETNVLTLKLHGIVSVCIVLLAVGIILVYAVL